MDDYHPPTFAWDRFGVQLLFALLFAWIVTLAYLSYDFTRQLLNPICPKAAEELTGYELVEIQTSRGLELQGWWQAPENGKVILLLGGLGSNRDTMLPEADILTGYDYGILTIDPRPCVGQQTTLGYRETEELQAMVDYALDQPEVNWLGVLGYSVGGVTAIRGAVDIEEIEAVISLGSYADLYKEITGIETIPMSLRWQIQQMVVGWYAWFARALPWEVSTLKALPQVAPRPVLLVFGENEMKRARGWEQFEASGDNSELWVVPQAGHGEYRDKEPLEYETRIVEFFNMSSSQ